MGASRSQGGGEKRGVPQGSGPAASAVSRSCRPPAAEARLPTPSSATRASRHGLHVQRLPLRAVPRRMPFQRSCDSALAIPHDPPQRRSRRCRGASAAQPRVCWTNPPSTRGTAATHAPPHNPPRRGRATAAARCLLAARRVPCHGVAVLRCVAVLSAARPVPRTFSPLRRDSVRDPSKKKPVGEVLPTGKRMGARMHTRMHACTHDAESAQADRDTHQHTHAHAHAHTHAHAHLQLVQADSTF